MTYALRRFSGARAGLAARCAVLLPGQSPSFASYPVPLPTRIPGTVPAVVQQSASRAQLAGNIDELVQSVAAQVQPGDQVVIMSNGGFGGIHQKLLAELAKADQ